MNPDMDLMDPEHILKAREALKERLSMNGDNGLQQLAESRKLNILKTQSEVSKLSSDELSNRADHLEFEARYIDQPMIDAYDKVKASGGTEEQATQAFNDAKTATLQLAQQIKDPQGKPVYTPEALKNLQAATPEHLKTAISHTKFTLDHLKAEDDRRKKQAETDELGARTAKDLAAANLFQKKSEGGLGDGVKMQRATMVVDGEQTQVNFHPMSGRYTLPTGEDVTAKVKPVEKGGLTPVQLGTVEKDIFEAKKFLDKTKSNQTSSLFFLDQNADKSAIRRFTENKLTREESQIYDVYANRLANAIVGMQSLGRYRGAVKSIDEARKMVPSPGDTPATIKAKREYIDEFTRDTDDELSKLSKNTKREKLMQQKVDKTKPVAGAPVMDDETLNLLDMYPGTPAQGAE
jgi:hypothetical protein